jgi:hypothetical protein
VAFLAHIEATYPGARRITLIADNATYDRAAEVRAWPARPACRVRIVHLPPYAPNLNLSERLSWFFKKRPLWKTHHPTFGEFRAAIRSLFTNLDLWTNELATLLTSHFHIMG